MTEEEKIKIKELRQTGNSYKQIAQLLEISENTIKTFCSDVCRNRWWNSHLDQVNRKANYEIRCLHCGKTFISYGNKNKKYCCHACYVAHRFGGN